MKKNSLILLLLMLNATLGFIAIQRNNELKIFKARPIKIMDCKHKNNDELLKLWCSANTSFDRSPYARNEKNRVMYINGWFHTLNTVVDAYSNENIDASHTVLSPIWKAAGYQSMQLLNKRYGSEINTLYNDKRFRTVTGQLQHLYDNAQFADKSAISKSQYTIGYLVGRLYGMEQPHSLSALNETDAAIKQYSKGISQSLVMNDKQSDYFNQGLIDGTTISVQQLSREVKASFN